MREGGSSEQDNVIAILRRRACDAMESRFSLISTDEDNRSSRCRILQLCCEPHLPTLWNGST